jgi:hypothetical protein
MSAYIKSNTDYTIDVATVSATGNIVAGSTITGTNGVFSGNLTVNGNVSYINIENLNVKDPIIGLGRGPNNAPLTVNDGKDRGEQLWYYSSSEKSSFIGYQNVSGKLIAATDVSVTGEVVTVNSYGSFVVGNLESTTVVTSGNITGGNLAISGTVSTTGGVTALEFIGDVKGDVLSNSSTVVIDSTTGDAFLNNVGASIVSATGNITGNYILGNGSQLTGMVDLSSVSQSILPSANVTYDLGSLTNRWKDLYLSNSTIYLGNLTVSATDGNLTVNTGFKFADSTVQTSAAISITDLQTLVAASTDFADFQTRIAAL